MRLTFVIRSLEVGGAERQLVLLAKELHKKGHDVSVVTFYSRGAFNEELSDAGVVVYSLDKKGRWDVLPFLFRAGQVFNRLQPEILHGYLSGANLLILPYKAFVPDAKRVWGVRASDMDFSRYDWIHKFFFALECRLARFADLIITNSRAGKAFSVQNGFPADKMTVIPNGINTERYFPDRAAGEKVRQEWGIAPDHLLIGLVGRLDPMKDHPTFLKAAALFAKGYGNARFVCVGDGPEEYRSRMEALSEELGLKDRLIWAGVRSDINAVYNALDLSTLSSAFGEGYPNVVGEAMSCGKRCVVTDVGDAAWIVGDTGVVVPIGDPERLVEGWERCLHLPDPPLPTRSRIEQNFSLHHLVDHTEDTLRRLLQ